MFIKYACQAEFVFCFSFEKTNEPPIALNIKVTTAGYIIIIIPELPKFFF